MVARASRTFRIFVSSTFTDLKEERDALQERVFPRLRELCMQHGARFQAIDLRWGVSEEAALDQQTMNICLGEIERCRKITPRPNFIVLLGDRYGWRPLPPQIIADEFEEICRRISAEEQQRLREWYERDDNAIAPEYCLKPREGEYEDFEKWEAVERDLCSILLKAVEEMPLEAYDRMKYEVSATEQEIARGALRVSDAAEHVFCFFRTIKDLPQGEGARDFVDLDASGNPDIEAGRLLDELKSRLRNPLLSNIHEYEARWTGSGVSTDHLDKLCDDVFKALSGIIEQEIARLEKVDALEEEVRDHEAFGEERARFFIGRAGILKAIGEYVAGSGRHPLAVWGASGSGKSALMARAVQQTRLDHPDAEVVVRFMGATPGSSEIRALLEGLCRQISRCYGADESTVPTEYRELVEEFPKRLALATAQQPLIVFLDGLDQLSDTNNARSLVWLPAELPDHVRLIVSTLPGECLSALERRLPATSLVELQPMPLDEGRQLLDLWLEDASRTLQHRQRDEVLTKFASNGLPLYLRLAFEEARRWKSFSTDTVLSPDIPGVIRDLFARLSSEANHGEKLVSRSLGYLVAAKNGLSEDELLDVLSSDEDILTDFRDRSPRSPEVSRLPVVVWSRLYFDLEPYLTERSADGVSLMTFYHRQLGEVAAQEYLAGAAKQERHRSLADYFEGRGHDYSRTLQELAYHLYQFALESGDCQRLYELVEDKSFKRRQFQHSGRLEPIVLNISYALDLAVRQGDPVQLVHFSMMRINLNSEFYKTSLYRFVETARPAPELARDVVGLVSNSTLRRMGLVLLAWLFNKEEGQREFVRELVEDAARISVPATVAEASALLEMIRDLHRSGVDEATGLLKSVPDCPVRQTYRRAWERGHEQIRALAAEMERTEADVPTSTGEEVAEFNKMQSFVGELERKRFLRSPPKQLEDRLAELFGPSGVSDAYFLLAAEQIHTGHLDAAAMLINRGIYVASAFPLPAIRTLAALVEAFGATGNRELAAEHDDRIRVLAKGLERAAKTEHELGRLADMRSELRIAMDRAAHTWRPPGSSRLFEGSIAEQLPHGTEREVDLLTALSSARQLLAQGHTRPVPAILREIMERVGQGEYEAGSQAVLVSVYALARACEEEALASACISRLNAEGLHPEALYLPGEASPQAARVFETLVVSDPRCVASVSLCLRLAGLYQRLLEFAQIANAVGAGVETLDAILSQVVRAPGVQPAGLRRVSEDILGTAKFLQIPSGLGWYYYPGIMLSAAWPGIVFSCVGLWAAIEEPGWIIFGLPLAAAGLVGGLLDLLVWRRVRLWERPEISRRWTAEIATIATFATLWGAAPLMRPVLTAMDSLVGVGWAVPVVLSLFLGAMMAWNGLLFAPLSSRFIRVGAIASALIGAVLGVIFAVFGSDLFPTSVLRGMFLGGMSLMAVGLNILPKRAAVVRHFGSQGEPDDGDMQLRKEGRAYVS